MKWNTEEENLVPIEHQYLLDDLYLYGDYDNVVRNEYEEQLSGRRQLEEGCPKEDNQKKIVQKETIRRKLIKRKQLEITTLDTSTREREKR